MHKIFKLMIILVMGLTLTLGGMSDADAKRFGGGSSFGSRPSHSAPYQRQVTPPARSAEQQPAARPNPGFSNRNGLMGLLGGLALGGLLGSMFAGGGFSGINFMDIAVFAGIAFLLYKWFAVRKTKAAPDLAYQRSANIEPQQTHPAGFDTDILFKNQAVIAPPMDFDQAAFLIAAKAVYTKLQKAWDQRDLANIRSLTTDKVFANIQDQLKNSTSENRTDILKLEAELLEFRELGTELEAVVLFDSIMREHHNAQAGQVREVWHFIRPKSGIQPNWLLDGIQQLED